MKIRMELLSDTVFGSGVSVPGGEDIAVLNDKDGFPYYKGSAFRGVFKEEFINYLHWSKEEKNEETVARLFGNSGDHLEIEEQKKLRFGDFELSDAVKAMVKQEGVSKEEVLEMFSYTRTFTSIDEHGMVKRNSLRSCRCIKKGLVFYSNCDCAKEDEKMVEEILSFVKWLGSMRNRGFGKVMIEREGEV